MKKSKSKKKGKNVLGRLPDQVIEMSFRTASGGRETLPVDDFTGKK